MKSFSFSLARVLHIRETQLKTEEGKLEVLLSGRKRIENEIEKLRESARQARQTLSGQPSLTSVELMALQSFEKYSEREETACRARISSHTLLIEKQMTVVVESRRNVRLLEKLRDRQFAAWRTEEGKELAALAEDFSAAQWARR